MTTAERIPQTVSFVLTVRYRQIERSNDLPDSVSYEFTNFEKMLTFYRKERRRRNIADRATSATYRMKLTDYGIARCQSDADCAARHVDAINGREMNV